MDFTTLQQALQQDIQWLHVELLLSVLIGMALSASCGFRVFVPPLVMSVAGVFFGINLPADIHWLSTYPAFLILLTATLLEVGAYYVPFLDHLLDTIATPAAVVAGTIITSSFIGPELPPAMQWTVALIAGGGAAGAVQSVTTLARTGSSAFTLGLANPLMATVENIMAVAVPVVSIVFPLLAAVLGILVVGVILFMGLQLKDRLIPRKTS